MRHIKVFLGPMGCVDNKTQFLTKNGWVDICKYAGEEIGVYTKDGNLKFEIPERFLEGSTDHWYRLKTKYGVDQKLTGEHNVYYITSKGNLYHKTMKEVYESDRKSRYGFGGKFITTFNNASTYELPYSDDKIRLLIAIQADGSYIGDKYKKYNFSINVKKDRKKERIKKLLESCGIQYHTYVGKAGNSNEGYERYYFYISEGFKEFPKEWWLISKRQMKVIYNEISFWDGYYNNPKKTNTYYTNSKNNADFIQFVFACNGIKASIRLDERRKNINYNVIGSQNSLTTVSNNKGGNISLIKLDKAESKYCFTTSTGMWIARRNNRIFITGNSGKTFNADKLAKELGYKRISFADSLRDIAFTSLGINPELIDYRKFKEENIYGNVNFRNYLQLLGDGIRRYNPDYFTQALVKTLENSKGDICVDDLRFGNEFVAVKEFCDKNKVNLMSYFCNYPSQYRNDKSEHVSEKMAQYFLNKNYGHLQIVDSNDIMKYYYNIENASRLKDDIDKLLGMLNKRG